MYAILEHGGHQYRVTSGDRLLVDRIPAEVGSTVTLERVLLLGDDSGSQSDGASLKDARVTAVVVAHRRGRKLRVFSFKPKKRRRRTLGYRSQLTELRIEEVAAAGGARSGRAAKAAPKTSQRRHEEPAAEKPAAVSEEKPAAAAPEEPAKPKAKPTAKRASTSRKKSDGA